MFCGGLFGSPAARDCSQEVQQTTLKVMDTIRDLETTIKGTEDVREDILEKVKTNLYLWKKTVLIEKSVYDVLNMLAFKGQTVVAECWAPKEDLAHVQTALSEAEQTSGAQVCCRLMGIPFLPPPPPTGPMYYSHQSPPPL